MAGFARAIADEGVAALRCNFPYMEAGKRSPDREPVAIATVRAAFAEADERAAGGEPVWVGGKSFGGRMASVAVAEGMPAAGLVFLGYPMHPPASRNGCGTKHLYGIEVPMLFLQGRGSVRHDRRAPIRAGDAAERDAARGRRRRVIRLERSRSQDAREVAASFAPLVAAFMRGKRA